jgi:hypothetical protein
VRYKKPRSFNLVSLLLLLVAACVLYLLIYLWPVYSASSRARGILLDHVPNLYKANLIAPDSGATMIERIKESIAAELDKAGINSKAAKIYITHDPKEITLQVKFKAKAHFPFPDRTFEFELSPRVVSDATRVDW